MRNNTLSGNSAVAKIPGLDDYYVVSEDWPGSRLAKESAKLGASLLDRSNGYAGSRNSEAVADYVIGLLDAKLEAEVYGCNLLIVKVVDEAP